MALNGESTLKASVTVYGASSSGIDPKYLQVGQELGKAIARKGWRLVNGGVKSGMMKACIDGALSVGGRVSVVILDKFVNKAYPLPSEVRIVDNMTERKLGLMELSDLIVVAPGGFGTLEEVFEVLSWNQLSLINKRVIFLNAFHFFDFLRAFLAKLESEHFISETSKSFYFFVDSVEETINLLEKISLYKNIEANSLHHEKEEPSFMSEWNDVDKSEEVEKYLSHDLEKSSNGTTFQDPWSPTKLGAHQFLDFVRETSRQFVESRGWESYNTPRNVLLAMVGEVGELAECFQWKGEVSVGLSEFSADERKHISEEVADVFIYLTRLSEICGIHLEDAVIRKLEKNEEKYATDKCHKN
ncbi:protoporphyrinogen oxidase [Galdieria sulphuraria]|uniref:Protoporphyrinogen oxidase n=1 Tax=Galdieria sulphuraria TaxID=130081 RepID=M2X1V0_GALSU|nr:protoporphyrinogen oxidase [Galdieria sulphuraria]EME30325.1 protoporphyrinogen oxidase [Galdieria sulphuraria]|eukprot:XP_005706845.1 protoporphyrinogen oxidase [Galdieria sulphuraria]